MVAHSDLEALDDDLIDAVLTANVRGPFATIRAFVPLLRASGDGVIVNISSGAAQNGTGSSIIYGASKAALNTMSMALARVLGPEIRVVVVAPGMVHTGFVPGRTEEMMAQAALSTPLKRAIEAHDVALAVMASITHLTHTTGSIVPVDAGRHL
jgi:3-oxoacyl-[acyl-carrier protein] reductase